MFTYFYSYIFQDHQTNLIIQKSFRTQYSKLIQYEIVCRSQNLTFLIFDFRDLYLTLKGMYSFI